MASPLCFLYGPVLIHYCRGRNSMFCLYGFEKSENRFSFCFYSESSVLQYTLWRDRKKECFKEERRTVFSFSQRGMLVDFHRL